MKINPETLKKLVTEEAIRLHKVKLLKEKKEIIGQLLGEGIFSKYNEFLEDLVKADGVQGGTIHQYINLSDPKTTDFIQKYDGLKNQGITPDKVSFDKIAAESGVAINWHKQEGIQEDNDGNYMSTQNVNSIISNAKDVKEKLAGKEDMEDWVEDKISKAAENLRSLGDYAKNKEKVNEWHDNEDFEMPRNMTFDVNDIKQVSELFKILSVDGIPDIRDFYPSWAINILDTEWGFIEENDAYVWRFNEEGKRHIKSPEQLQKFLQDEGGFTKPIITKFDQGDAPYLRGQENYLEEGLKLSEAPTDLSTDQASDIMSRVKDIDPEQSTRFASIIRNKGIEYAIDKLKNQYGANVMDPNYFGQLKSAKKKKNAQNKVKNMMVGANIESALIEKLSNNQIAVKDINYSNNLDTVESLQGLKDFPLEEITFKVVDPHSHEEYDVEILNHISSFKSISGIYSMVSGTIYEGAGIYGADAEEEVDGPARPGEMKDAVFTVVDSLMSKIEASKDQEDQITADAHSNKPIIEEFVKKLPTNFEDLVHKLEKTQSLGLDGAIFMAIGAVAQKFGPQYNVLNKLSEEDQEYLTDLIVKKFPNLEF